MRMKGEQDADKLATGSGNGNGNSSYSNSNGSWWWRHKRRSVKPTNTTATTTARELEEADDEQLALREQLRPGKCNSNNNGTASIAGCELAKASNNSQKYKEGTRKLDHQQQQQQQQQSSYSKIFSQYLSASLNANNSSSNNNQQLDDAKQQHQRRKQQSTISSSYRVVSALSRFSGRKGSSSWSSSSTNKSCSSEEPFIPIANQQRPKSKVTNEQLEQQETKANIKRKGFLYLKKPRDSTTDIVQQRNNNKLVTKTRDLNNNNNSSNYINCNYENKNHDEHKERLIEESDPDSDTNQEEKSIYSSQQQQQQQQQPNQNQKQRLEANNNKMKGRGKKSSTDQHLNYKADGPLLTTASFVAIGLIVICFASTIVIRSTNALQSAQPPFVSSRSQQQQQQQLQQQQQQQQQQPPLSSSAGNGGDGSSSSRPLPQPAAGSLVANVNCNKIRGHVTLTPNLQGGTSVSAQILAGPPGEFYQWSVHQFPVKPGAAMCSCSALILGSKLIDMSQLHGNLPSEQEQNVQSSINLFGPDSPVGHSLMLRGLKTGLVACATFLPTSRKSNYRAKFHAPLSGSVTIFQTAFGTSFTSHLMYSNGTRRHSVHQFDLVKSDDDIITTPLQPILAPPGGRTTNNNVVSDQQSFEQLAQREHDNELNQCKRLLRGDASGEALLRNSSYQLSVSTENFGMRGRTSMVLPQIPFETFSSVYVVIYSEYNSNEPIACAPLRFVKPKQAAAKFQSVSVQGSVTFTQDSPYDVTVARINLNLPNSDGHSYGIDELPMIIRRKSDTRVCPNIREIIYNPHHVEPSSVPPEGEATSDQYAVGDLSGKYGSLTGKSSEKIQVNDYNLALFGATSIIGRAMTIYSADGVAIACSNVELTTPMTTAFATFDYGIQGQFIFRQPANDCNGDTYVYIEVSKPVVSSAAAAAAANGGASGSAGHHQHHDSGSRSLDHNWHIHVSPVDSGLDHLSSTECTAAGGHYNPYNISTSGIYSRDCTPFNVLRCELGDLSAKMFTIDIPPYRVKGGQEPDIGKFFGTDIDLPLCGPVSVVNRSVVVHVQDFGMQRLACSTVIEFKPRSPSS